jgi:hypothetical protein
MSELEEQELSDYCWRLAIMDAKNDNKLEIAKKMVDRGCSIQFISECTDLSIDQINEIIKNCND